MCVYAFLSCALLALSSAAAWSPDCAPCSCGIKYLSGTRKEVRSAVCDNHEMVSVPMMSNDTQLIEIAETNISSLKGNEFDSYPHLTHIQINWNPYITVLPTGLFSKTQNIIFINLNDNNLKILHSHTFANLIHLENVWLERNLITVVEDNCFSNVPKLSVISFHKNSLSKININFTDDFNSLKHLFFHANPVHCDENVCELMNRVVQRRMFKEDEWMPTCASPASVQGKTWDKAVGALWGAGLERCPHPAEMNLTENPLQGEVDVEKEPGTTEINLIENPLQEEVDVEKKPVSTGTEMHVLRDAVVQLLAKSHVLFMEEMNKTMPKVRNEMEHVKNELAHVNSELKNMNNDLGHVKKELLSVKDGQLQLENKMYEVNDMVHEMKAKVNSLYVVKDGQQKLKESIDVIMRQNEQIINRTDTLLSPNILFKEVLHVSGNSSGRGLLQLLYSILPAPRNATGDL